MLLGLPQGPRALQATAYRADPAGSGVWTLTIAFAGGRAPFRLGGTRNCTTCCYGSAPNGSATAGHTLDLDILQAPLSPGGEGADVWVNATGAVLNRTSGTVTATVWGGRYAPLRVRHTAASIFPQCALYNADGLPAPPFELEVE